MERQAEAEKQQNGGTFAFLPFSDFFWQPEKGGIHHSIATSLSSLVTVFPLFFVLFWPFALQGDTSMHDDDHVFNSLLPNPAVC